MLKRLSILKPARIAAPKLLAKRESAFSRLFDFAQRLRRLSLPVASGIASSCSSMLPRAHLGAARVAASFAFRALHSSNLKRSLFAPHTAIEPPQYYKERQ